MKINTEVVMCDLSNEPINGQSIGLRADEPCTLGAVCVVALLAPSAAATLTGDEKVRRAKLAEKLSLGGIVDLPAEDVVTVKGAVGEVYAPLVVMRAWDALEGS